jgi:hypothetical protein
MVMPMPSVIMHKRPPKTVIRAAIARLSSPPAAHNLRPGDLPLLTGEEMIAVEQAREALGAVRRTFEFWVAIARGLATLRAKADAIGGYCTFARLRQREGLGLPRTTVHRLLKINARIREVEAWRASLSERERFRWAGPEAILRHCPLFAPAKPAANPGGGKWPRIEPTDSADAIATVLVGMFLPRKAEAVFRAGLAQLKARERRPRA